VNFQYPLKRKDPQYTRPLESDAEFFEMALKSDLPELTTVYADVAKRDFVKASDGFLKLIRETSARRFYYGVDEIPELASFVRENYPSAEIDRTIAAANRLVAGNFGNAGPHFPSEMSIENGRYPWVEGSDRDTFPRFGFLDALTHAHAFTRDQTIARCFSGLIADFLRECPVPRDATFRLEHGVWHPLTAAVRIFSWAPAFVGFLDADEWPAAEKLAMIKSFHQHGLYIREYHAAHGNHALMQMRALTLIALLFPEFCESGGWLRYALEQFPPRVAENVYPDGVQFEGSPGYHVIVMRDLFGILPLLRRCGIDAPETISGPLEKMFEVLMHFITPDIDLPTFGDTGTAKGPEDRELPLEEIMAVGALLFKRADFKSLATPEFPLRYLWSFGPGELQSYRDLVPQPPDQTATYFPTGGYMVSRENWTDPDAKYLIMRAGVGVGGHCHSDALSIIARAFGKDLVVDSGKGVYEWTPERKYLISTRAHNTVVIDGQDQHVRNFHWGSPPSAPCQIWDFRSNDQYDFFFASHYGYTRFDDPVVHTRKVLFVKNRYWLIIDLLQAKAHHLHDLYFHLPIGEVSAHADLSRIHTCDEGGRILIARVENEAVRTSVTESLIYTGGKFHPNPAVKYSQATTGPAHFATVLAPFTGPTPMLGIERIPASIEGKTAVEDEVTALAITFDGMTDRICINHTSIDVTTYLDYNGNPVPGPLLDKRTDRVAVEFLGQTYRSDVVIA
jgi:Heparinase II/III N-terminus/Heparinase II/III-like protein